MVNEAINKILKFLQQLLVVKRLAKNCWVIVSPHEIHSPFSIAELNFKHNSKKDDYGKMLLSMVKNF
jgi:hypothetical protein